MRDKIQRWIEGLRRDHGGKILTALDVALVIVVVLIVMALAEIGAAK